MPSPLVTIIIPTYNRLPVICRAVDSALSQSYSNIECIVIDDFSSDATLSTLSEKYVDRITVLRNDKNRDKSYTRNKGINSANGEYICFLDSDDELTKDSVEERVNIFLSDPSFDGVVFGLRQDSTSSSAKVLKSCKFHTGDLLTLDSYLDNSILLSTNSFLMTKANMLKYGMYNETINNKEDIELFLRLLTSLPFKFCGTIVTIVHQDADNRARNDSELFLAQERKFTDIISANRQLMVKLGPRFGDIQRKEHDEVLRALYHAGKGKMFRQVYAEGWSNKMSNRSFKFLKRYFLSYFKFKS